jgi:hypothetical protein
MRGSDRLAKSPALQENRQKKPRLSPGFYLDTSALGGWCVRISDASNLKVTAEIVM